MFVRWAIRIFSIPEGGEVGVVGTLTVGYNLGRLSCRKEVHREKRRRLYP